MKFKIHISRVTLTGTSSKEFKTEQFGIYVNRYPDNHLMKGNVKDVQLAMIVEGKLVTYPFIGLWISEAEEEEEEEEEATKT